MKSKIQLSLSLAALLSSTISFAENCTQIEVLNDQCVAASIKASLSKCEDDLISVQSVKCKDNQMKIFLRGAESDYRVVLETKKDSWGKGAWSIKSETEVEHRTTAKTLPKTEHERPGSPEASVTVPAPGSNPADAKVASAFLFSAFFDAYYAYNFNKPRPSAAFPAAQSSQNNLRAYDWHANQLDLSLAEITIKHVRKETSFVVDLDFGQFADLNAQTVNLAASGGPSTGTPNEATKHIGQAVFTYTPAAAPAWVFELGKMPTHVGLELMKSKDNWNYSRSALFTFGGPLWHTGMHLGYTPVANQFAIGAYLYNGWNTVYDNNFIPTYGLQMKWTPNDKFTWIYNYLGGPEQDNNSSNWKQVHETNISYTLTPTLSVATDFLYGKEKAAVADGLDKAWYGFQLGAKWQTGQTYYLSPRFEIYRDSHGYTLGGVGQTLYTYTLTQSYLISEGFELRLEGRLDHSTLSDRFVTGTGTSSNQPTVILGVLYTM